MKYLIIVTDGAGDGPIEALGGKTPLEAAHMPHADHYAARGIVGSVCNVPEGMAPGSDVANLSVMGYDPKVYHTGRSPLEAASIGVDLKPTDVSYRCNFVTLSDDEPYEAKTMVSYASGEISTEECAQLVKVIEQELSTDKIHFYTGVSYRHAMVVADGLLHYEETPPHDIPDRVVGDYLPKGEGSEFLLELMKKSYPLLKDHPVNKARIAQGLCPANSIWLWGQGKKPALMPIREKYGVDGSVISAVDLIKGIGICAGMESIDVPGVTGTIHTNYEGKAQAAIDAFKRGKDFVYLHMEAPDECSHQGNLEEKVEALGLIDSKIIGPVLGWLEESGEDFRFLLVPDHQTPMRIRTHSADPVPFVLYDSTAPLPADPSRTYTEPAGAKGEFLPHGHELADRFFVK